MASSKVIKKTLISRASARERKRFLEEAQTAAYLDAVFLIHYYNSVVNRCGPPPKPDDIDPREAFGDYDRALYEESLTRARQLLDASYDVGRAYFRYEGVTESYEEALARLRSENPGFGKRSYSLAVEEGLRAMR